MAISRATEYLNEWLEGRRRGEGQEWLAKQVGVHQTTVSIWLRGSEPKMAHAMRLFSITGCKLAWWNEAPRSKRSGTAA